MGVKEDGGGGGGGSGGKFERLRGKIGEAVAGLGAGAGRWGGGRGSSLVTDEAMTR